MGRYGRALVKLSGEALMGDRPFGIDPLTLNDLARQIRLAVDEGVEVAVSIGGGNFWRGATVAETGMDRATADYAGMLGTIMNALALQDALEKAGVPSRVQSALQMPAVAESFIRRKAIRHMEKGRVILLAAGTGVPYVTTDTGASLHALELKCDVLMKATKVDGIYDQDPQKFPNARRYKTLTFNDAIQNKDIDVMDTAALAMAKENNMPVMVFELFKENNLQKAVDGENIGTYVSNDVETVFAE